MSDGRIRELERRVSAGDPEAEVALLRERLRIGELTEKQLRLTAFLGHTPSQDVLDKCPKCLGAGIDPGSIWLGVLPPGPDFPTSPQACPVCGHTTYTFDAWVWQIQKLLPSHQIAVRAAYAAATHSLDWWMLTGSRPRHMSCVVNCQHHQSCIDWRQQVRDCLGTVGKWIEEPTEERMRNCIREANRLNYGAQFVFHTCRSTMDDGAGRSSAGEAITTCARMNWGASTPPEIANRLIQQAIAVELVPWILA